MAKAIFHREFHYTSMTRNAGWSAYPKAGAQSYPREFIDAAVAAGCAEEVKATVCKGRTRTANAAHHPDP
ncbi:hypothetical protein [Paracoccus sp. KR1-242]|uniref:hypothetical protein n=1 Tax=Paracoccus sp. KR1-242 TaxID=3410028 RepID=UPI003C0942A3